MVETLLARQAEWIAGTGPDADLAILSQCRLTRNLKEFPFPGQCSDTERAAIEKRLVDVLDALNLTRTGTYFRLADLDDREVKFLFERLLIPYRLWKGTGPRGVYIADDQSFSIAINGEDHVEIQAHASGVQIEETWSRVSAIDDQLAGNVDFAFNDRLGYLTTSVHNVGTGLKASTLLHLPGLAMTGEREKLIEDFRDKRFALNPVVGPHGEELADLFRLINPSTLGRPESEIVLRIKMAASDLVGRERSARARIRTELPLQLEDRVGRALGVARGARLLEFGEGVSVLSSLRMSVSEGLLEGFGIHAINEVFMASHSAQIELKLNQSCDELTLSSERADLFRARFA